MRVTAVGKPQASTETKPIFERARPQATLPTNPIQTATVAQRAAIPSKPATSLPNAPRSYNDEPERDMFEQGEFVPAQAEQASVQSYAQQQAAYQQQAAGLRGTLHDGHFIPPKPLYAEQQEPASSYGGGFPLQGGNKGYNLNPPVPGANSAAQAAKKPPSLFERITSGVRHAAQAAQREDVVEDLDHTGGQQQATGTGGFHSALRATPRIGEQPAQGQLNIDAPSASRAKSEEELDIPAFLRRQAN